MTLSELFELVHGTDMLGLEMFYECHPQPFFTLFPDLWGKVFDIYVQFMTEYSIVS